MEEGISYAAADDDAATNSETVKAEALTCRTDELKKIKDRIISGNHPSDLKIVTIVGMGGIGKTFLAKTIYDDVQISCHFHLRGWVTISQNYKRKNVLLDLLTSMNIVSESEEEGLAETLYRNLKGRRFLIVLDDVWDVNTWNDFRCIFPNDSNGSRVILTSRHEEVASFAADSNSPPHSLNCLSNEECWRLLHTQVFAEKPCLSHLVKIGKKIAKKCQGLPLVIVVVAGYLSQIEKKRDCWEEVAETLDSLITRNEEKILDILCLSYNHLSQQLKACFLYMGIFPKNSDIQVVKLIRLWTAVGFLQTENEALRCLEDLISRNLVRVGRKKYDDTAKTCRIHDLLWDLILREAKKEGHSIFSSLSLVHYHFSASNYNDMKYLMDLTGSYRYLGDSFYTDLPDTSACNCFRTLRVLEIQSHKPSPVPEMITSLVGLRYLELPFTEIPESFSRLCNLETLIIGSTDNADLFLPSEIWLLPRLRHLQLKNVSIWKVFLKDACVVLDSRDISPFHEGTVQILPNLQTLSRVCFGSLPDQVFCRIPNVKRLKICKIDCQEENDEKFFNFLNDMVHVCELEKLILYFRKQFRLQQQQVGLSHFFPQGIKQLTLRGCKLQWEEMNILAKLPNIEVLQLKKNAFTGPIYIQDEEGFPRLRVLLFEKLELKRWIAETFHYPVLQNLVLIHCHNLQEIPPCFGEMTTLQSIELGSCSSPVKESVGTIQQEQQNFGNYDLRVRLYLAGRERLNQLRALALRHQ